MTAQKARDELSEINSEFSCRKSEVLRPLYISIPSQQKRPQTVPEYASKRPQIVPKIFPQAFFDLENNEEWDYYFTILTEDGHRANID